MINREPTVEFDIVGWLEHNGVVLASDKDSVSIVNGQIDTRVLRDATLDWRDKHTASALAYR